VIKKKAIRCVFVGTIFFGVVVGTAMGDDLSKGLLGWWKFDEAAGVKIRNSSGDGGDMVLAREVYRVPGIAGRAVWLHFITGRGEADIIGSIENTPKLMPSEQMTISGWILCQDAPRGQIVYKMGQDAKSRVLMFDKEGDLIFGLNVGGEYRELRVKTFADTVANKRWHLVAATYDGEAMAIYDNDTKLGSIPVKGKISSDSSDPIHVGAMNPGVSLKDGEYAAVCIDDLRIYERALSHAEIKSLYATKEKEIERLSKQVTELCNEIINKHKKMREQALAEFRKERRQKRNQPVDMVGMAELALDVFMQRVPKRVAGREEYYKSLFVCNLYPLTCRQGGQWDHGDCTARAVQGWQSLREITGDDSAGMKVETGQRNYLLSIIHPASGLVYVPTMSDQKNNQYFFHIWDQSRTLRALCYWYMKRPNEREKIKPYLDGMIKGLYERATIRGMDPEFGPYAGLPSDTYDAETPGDRVSGWVNMRAGLVLEPIVMYAEFTGDPEILDIAIRFANCTLGGHEGDAVPENQRAKYKFGKNGSFTWHSHTRTAALVGIAKLGRYLAHKGRREEAKKYLAAARRGYDWTIAEKGGGGSRMGWVPEGPRGPAAETCCGADAIELAEVLASCCEIGPEYYDWAELHGDVEAMVVNIIAFSQIEFTAPFERILRETYLLYTPDCEAELDTARRFNGTWPSSLVPNDFSDGHKIMLGGCCQYAGVRALYTGWHDVMNWSKGILRINYLLNRSSEYAQINTCQPVEGKSRITILKQSKVLLRIPEYIGGPSQMVVKVNGEKLESLGERDVTGHYIALGRLNPGDRIEVGIPLTEKVTEWRGATIHWRGNYVMTMDPAGLIIPLFPSVTGP